MDAELFVVKLDTDPEPDATVDAEEVAEGERERGAGEGDGCTEREDAGSAEGESSVDAVDMEGGTGRGCFLGRPRGRLTLTAVTGGVADVDGVEAATVGATVVVMGCE